MNAIVRHGNAAVGRGGRVVQKMLLLSLAGALGTMARYGVSGLVQRLAGTSFPLGTLLVNLSGCLLFGLVFGLFEERIGLPAELRFFILTGFMGAYTTFSSYMFESVTLLQHGQWLAATVNIVGQTVAGITLTIIGMALGKIV
jgi:CrcB protein